MAFPAPLPGGARLGDLRRGAEQFPDKIALIDAAGTRSTYRDLWEGARRAAALLQRQADLAPGETVALGAAGTREFVVAMYGAFLAGGRVTTFNTNLKERELLTRLTDASAVVALAPAPAWWTIEQLTILGELDRVRWVSALDDIWALQKDQRRDPEAVAIEPLRHVALLPYSSGTSGLPKGVMLTHANLTASSRQLAATGWVSHDSIVMTLRLFSNAIRLVFAQGATAIAQSRLDPDETLAMLGAHHASHLMLRPTYLRLLARRALSSPHAAPALRVIETGGEPLPPSTVSLAARVRVLRPGHEVSAAALIAHAADRLAEHKRLGRVDVVAELPRGQGGKVQRSGLREGDPS